jgi:hypothetical protein
MSPPSWTVGTLGFPEQNSGQNGTSFSPMSDLPYSPRRATETGDRIPFPDSNRWGTLVEARGR